MKFEKLYDNWIRRKNEVALKEDFTDKVMSQVHKCEWNKRNNFFSIQRLIETVTAHPVIQAAMIALGVLIGLVRLSLMLHILLRT